MKTNNFSLVNMMNVLDKYSSKKLPQKISFAITKNIIILHDDIETYRQTLEKIFNTYSDHFIFDENKQPKVLDNGIPIVEDEYAEKYTSEINELLAMEVDVDLYTIPEEYFDYEDEKNMYDILSAQDILMLRSILCENDLINKND